MPSILEEQSNTNDSTFLIRRIAGNIMGRFDDWVFLDSNLKYLNGKRIPEPAFDFRDKWYTEKVDSQELVWNDIRILNETGHAGLILSIVTNESPIAVFGIKLSFIPFTNYLIRRSNITNNGLVLALIDKDGQVISSSLSGSLRPSRSGNLIKSNQLKNLVLDKIVNGFLSEDKIEINEIKKQKWFVISNSFPMLNNNSPLFLIAAVPMDSFLNKL